MVEELFWQILTFRIKEHISPAKGSGGNTPSPPRAQKTQLSFFSQPPYGVHLSRSGGLLDFGLLTFFYWWIYLVYLQETNIAGL